MKSVSYGVITGLALAVAAAAGAQSAEPAPPTQQTAAAQAPAASSTPVPNPVVLTVNGDPVHAADVSLAMQSLAARAQQTGNKLSEDQLFQTATSQVVETKLLAQEAQRQNLKADDTKVHETMDRIEKQAGGRPALEAALARGGMLYSQLQDRVAENDMVEQLVTTKIEPTIQVSESEVTEYYNAHPDMFKTPEKVHARHILFTAGPEATEEERKEARAKAEKARERALAGEDFAALAKELSQCPSAPKGGDLGYFSESDMVKPFWDAAYALEPGKISDVVETQFGYHVIKSEGRLPAGTSSLADVHDQLKVGMSREKLSEAVDALLGKLKADAKIVSMTEDSGAAPPAPSSPAPAPSAD